MSAPPPDAEVTGVPAPVPARTPAEQPAPVPGSEGTARDHAPAGEPSRAAPFHVHLDNFTGPFDLLLQLISKHQLDVTEVALSQVTDEFIAHIRAAGVTFDLGQATEFLVVAATLLDLKAARLLPVAEVEDPDDLALLEARDLLFARLLQYRAYKEVAAWFREREAVQSRRHPRSVAMEPRFASLLPEVLLGLGPEQFARLAETALTPKAPPVVSLDHVHTVRVSVHEHAALLRERLSRAGSASFRSLIADCRHTLEVVARFLALLDLYREMAVTFEQVSPLGELHVRWTGNADGAGGAAGTGAGGPHTDGPDTDIDEEYG